MHRSLFKPLKTFYNIECGSWLREHPGRKITTDQLGGIFSKAYNKAIVEIACSGFRTSGICPFCPDIIPDTEFNDDKRSNVTLHKPDKIESQVNSSTLLPLPSGSSENIDFDITPCFSNIVPIPKIILPPKKGEESQIITTSHYRKSLFESSEKSKKLKERKIENKSALGKGKEKVKSLSVEDWECYVCNGLWSKAANGEKSSQCSKCTTWAHSDCCSFQNTGQAICDLCD